MLGICMQLSALTSLLISILTHQVDSSPITFDASAIKYSCSDTTSVRTPLKLLPLSQNKVNNNGYPSQYDTILLKPSSGEGELCTLTRKNSEFSTTYIPIARSYDGNDWSRSAGKYLEQMQNEATCGTSATNGLNYNAGEYLCQLAIPTLLITNDGYYLTKFDESEAASNSQTRAARFLEFATFGGKLNEITNLSNDIDNSGNMAIASWVHDQVSPTVTPVTSHRKYFRERMSPRAVESYQYGIPGPKACEMNARYRRFAFTFKDAELSRGDIRHWDSDRDSATHWISNGLPFTPMEVENDVDIGDGEGGKYTVIKFNGDIRTILDTKLQYYTTEYLGQSSYELLADNNGPSCQPGFEITESSVCQEAADGLGLEYNNEFSVSSWSHTPCGCFLWGTDASPPVLDKLAFNTGSTCKQTSRALGMICNTEPSPHIADVPNGSHTICNAEELLGEQMGELTNEQSENRFFQILSEDDLCTSSYTNRTGVEDYKGDGMTNDENIRAVNIDGTIEIRWDYTASGQLAKDYDRKQCAAKCVDKARKVVGGNPEVKIPHNFDLASISWLDLSGLADSEFININTEKTYDSDWVLKKALEGPCQDENGNDIPDPAGLAFSDLSSTGRGRYNIDSPIFAKMPGDNRWALHDFRTDFKGNTISDPLSDGGGDAMVRSARGDKTVTLCSNTPRNPFNEETCKISYHPNACESVPKYGSMGFTLSKYTRSYAGPDAGVVVCGSPNEVAPDPNEGDVFDVRNFQVHSHRVIYEDQKRMTWAEVIMASPDELCQKIGWTLSKIFSFDYSTRADNKGNEVEIAVYDNFVTNCFSTYKEVMKRASFIHGLAEQLTYEGSKSLAYDWHLSGKIRYPDENYGRENLQIHGTGVIKLHEDGTPMINNIGRRVPVYEERHIYTSSKIWTGFITAYRRGNYEEYETKTSSRVDPLRVEIVKKRDWFPKIDLDDGYVGDRYPLCADQPKYHFLKKGAKYKLLGGAYVPQSHNDRIDSDSFSYETDLEVYKFTLDSESDLFHKLCKPKNPQQPSSTLPAGDGTAIFDTSFKAPYCQGTTTSCDSGTLLEGRFSETNAPNTIDGCKDGPSDPYAKSRDRVDFTESVKKIIVESAKEGNSLRGGELASIRATVITNSVRDRVDFYFSNNAASDNPTFTYITTVPTVVGEHEVVLPYKPNPQIQFELPPCTEEAGCQFAVRVAVRSSRSKDWKWDYNKFNRQTFEEGQHKPLTRCHATDPFYSNQSKDPSYFYGSLVPEEFTSNTHKRQISGFDDVDDIVFDVLPNHRPEDLCDFDGMVELDTNLDCHDRECQVDTVNIVQVLPGVFYEYIRLPCVIFPVYSNSVKVYSGTGWQYNMCADRNLPSALATCCGGYSDREPEPEYSKDGEKYADILAQYRDEKITFDSNEKRCLEDWERTVCDSSAIKPGPLGSNNSGSGNCFYRQSCRDLVGHNTKLEYNRWSWTSDTCSIQVKVHPSDGMIAIVHSANGSGSVQGSAIHSLVNPTSTVSFFYVHWDSSNVEVGARAYPHVEENNCNGGIVLEDEYCLCDTSVEETVAFTELPTRTEVLQVLKIGAFNPMIFDGGTISYSAVVETSDEGGVSVYKKTVPGEVFDDYSVHTIFRVKDEHGPGFMYLKNVHSTVRVCNSIFSFKNAPSFYNINDPQILSAHQEIDAYLEVVQNNANTPPFVCVSITQHFGHSNPSPRCVNECSQAFKAGSYTFVNPNDSNDVLTFGNGKRGNLAAVAASIVLCNDVLSPTVDADPSAGQVKEPMMKLMQVMRGLEFTRTLHHRRTDGFLKNLMSVFGQSPMGNENQFSFFSPFFLPDGAHTEAYLVAPEANLLTLENVIYGQNALYSLIQNGLNACENGIGPYYRMGGDRYVGGCGNNDGQYDKSAGYLDFTPSTSDLSDSSAVVAELATLLTANRLSVTNRAIIENAYANSLGTGGEAKEKEALQMAKVLMLSTPEFSTTNIIVPNDNERQAPPTPSKDISTPYKAIVQINLVGGMDSMNLLVPYPDDNPGGEYLDDCSNLYNEYTSIRGTDNKLSKSELTRVDASSSDQPCRYFGVNSALNDIAASYINDGDVLFFANVGYLTKPVNRRNFRDETQGQLFGHTAMTSEMSNVDAFEDRQLTGVMGRMIDVLGNNLATSKMSIGGAMVSILQGDPSLDRQVREIPSSTPKEFISSSSNRETLKPIITQLNHESEGGYHADFWSQKLMEYRYMNQELRDMLGTVTSSTEGTLGQVVKLIKLRDVRQVNRDVFTTSPFGGFDHHKALKASLKNQFEDIDATLKKFKNDLESIDLGNGETMWDSVTVIITSEFGRTLTPNSSGGTDHGWGGNTFIQGGKVAGGRILGHHPDNYSLNDDHVTGRGAWIPTTSWEGIWYPIAQWFGITSDFALNYVFPNLNNFGCRLYSDSDLYIGGTGTIPGCGGAVVELEQVFFLNEPRLLSPGEQKAFCVKVTESVSQGGSSTVRCVILDQIIAARDPARRRDLNEGGEYELDVIYEVSSGTDGEATEDDQVASIENAVNSPEFAEEVQTITPMEVQAQPAVVITSSPTSSPTRNPTFSPTRPDICSSILTSQTFDGIIPPANRNAAYTHSDFCTAVDDWNDINNPDSLIFMGESEMDKKNELAAFFGYYSSDLVATEAQITWASAIASWQPKYTVGSFGQSLNAISEGSECTGYDNSDIARLNDYCHAASELEVAVLLSFDGCDGLQTVFDNCITSATSDPTAIDACGNCLVWEGITLNPSSSPTKSPTTKPTDAPSSIPSEQPSISTNPSISTVPSSAPFGPLPAFYGYEYVGQGICQGDSLFLVETYDYLEYDGVQSSYDCPSKCAPYRGTTSLRGFEFSSSSCRCLFDDGTDLTAIVSDNSGDTPSNTYSTNGARGTIVDVVADNDVECYKKLEVIIGPEEAASFEYIGFGHCLSSSSLQYDYITISAGADDFAVECGAACVDFDGIRGFWVKEGESCHCLFDDEATVDGQTMNNPTNDGGGTDVISSSDYTEGHCYKVRPSPSSQPSIKPSISSQPSSMPSKSPSVSANPSSQPSENPSISSSPSSIPSESPSVSAQPSSIPSESPSISTNPSTPLNGPSPSVSSPPSSIPSESPSVSGQPSSIPSLSPSISVKPSIIASSIPSGSPSVSANPSSQPSENPSISHSPSSIPSESPSVSAQPSSTSSESPSVSSIPSIQPTTSVVPSTGPSQAQTGSPTKKPTSTVSFSISGSLVIVSAADICSLSQEAIAQLLQDFADELESTGCPEDMQSCTVVMQEPDCQSSNTRLLRRLETPTTLEYEIIIEAICSDGSCSNEDAQSVANEVYKQVTDDLLAAINNGQMIQDVIAASSAEVANLLTAATITGDFSSLVLPLLSLLTEFYPDWTGNSETCLNDGKPPRYMKKNGGYFENTLKACCERWYSWDIHTCMNDTPSVEGFYPNWGNSESKCIKASEDTPPGYMLSNPSQWLYSDLDDCCSNYYNWEIETCLKNSGQTVVGSFDWYVDWTLMKCVRDCDGSDGSNCGGLASNWDPRYADSSDCCKRLWWLDDEFCTDD